MSRCREIRCCYKYGVALLHHVLEDSGISRVYLRNPIDPPDLAGSESLYNIALDLALPIKTLKSDLYHPELKYRGTQCSSANSNKRMSVPPDAFRCEYQLYSIHL